MKLELISQTEVAAASSRAKDIVTAFRKKAGSRPEETKVVDFTNDVTPPRRKKKRPAEFIDLVTDDEGPTPPRSKKRTVDSVDNATESSRKWQKQKPTPIRAVKECILCCEEIPAFGFPEAPHYDLRDCRSSVCFTCWKLHLEHEVKDKKWNDIRCPECRKPLIEEELKVLALKDTYMLWLDNAAKHCSESSEEFRSCPSATCSWGCFFSTKEDGNIFACQMCAFRYCVVCEVGMHDSETCAEYQKRMQTQDKARENLLSDRMIQKTSKPCPKCSVRIDKFTGCDHVTCSRATCRHEFCWVCSAPFAGPNGIHTKGNGSHEGTCKYHTSRLRA